MKRLRYLVELSDTEALFGLCRAISGIGMLHAYRVREDLLSRFGTGERTVDLRPTIRSAQLTVDDLKKLIDGTWDDSLMLKIELSCAGADVFVRGKYHGTLEVSLSRSGANAFCLIVEGEPEEVAPAAFTIDPVDSEKRWLDETDESGSSHSLSDWRRCHCASRG